MASANLYTSFEPCDNIKWIAAIARETKQEPRRNRLRNRVDKFIGINTRRSHDKKTGFCQYLTDVLDLHQLLQLTKLTSF